MLKTTEELERFNWELEQFAYVACRCKRIPDVWGCLQSVKKYLLEHTGTRFSRSL